MLRSLSIILLIASVCMLPVDARTNQDIAQQWVVVDNGEPTDAGRANRDAWQQGWNRWLDILMETLPPVPSPVEESSWREIKSR